MTKIEKMRAYFVSSFAYTNIFIFIQEKKKINVCILGCPLKYRFVDFRSLLPPVLLQMVPNERNRFFFFFGKP